MYARLLPGVEEIELRRLWPAAFFIALLALTYARPVPASEFHLETIPNFSAAGYGDVGQNIPNLPDIEVLSPPAGDAWGLIQSALDRAASSGAVKSGFRGAVTLLPGQYLLSRPIRISASGIVLRGTKSSWECSTLVPVGDVHPAMIISGDGRWKRTEIARKIVGKVSLGGTQLELSSVVGLRLGDDVIVQKPLTETQIVRLGMDIIPPRPDGQPVRQWFAGKGTQYFRKLLGFVGARSVQIDAPVMDPISESDGATLGRYEFPGRIDNAGVEDLCADGTTNIPPPAQQRTLEGLQASTFIIFDAAANVWARNIQLKNFATFVDVRASARDVTVRQINATNDWLPWWKAKPAGFSVTGQKVLVEDCSISADSLHVWSTQAWAAGPNVFRQCIATGRGLDAGPHQRWAVGTLYEQLKITGKFIVQNSGNLGTGQGWTANTTIIWNSEATEGLKLEEPPGGRNLAVGFTGPLLPTTHAKGPIYSHTRHVEPVSLFESQVKGALAAPNGNKNN